MFVCGVFLSAGAVALLALCLERAGQPELAETIGSALDSNRQELDLSESDQDDVLDALVSCPVQLQPLEAVLRAKDGQHIRGL